MPYNNGSFIKAIFFFVFFICVCVGLTLLKVAGPVIKPVVVSVLLSFVFLPVIKKLNAIHIPWWICIVIVYVLFLAVCFGVTNILISGITTIINSLPRYEEKLRHIYNLLVRDLNIPFDNDTSISFNIIDMFNVKDLLGKYALSVTNVVYSFSKSFMLVILFSVFLLAEMHFTREKIKTAFSGSSNERVNNALHNIINDVTRYISIKFVISLATGVLVWLASVFVQMDFSLVWGFLTFIMNFIPTFGSIISCALTILFSIISFYPLPFPIIFISAVSIGTNFILGNIIEPRIDGKNLNLSPFVILVSLTIWGWIWGFLGMLIAVPVMVIIKIICENISYLKPIAILLGNKPAVSPRENTKIESESIKQK